MSDSLKHSLIAPMENYQLRSHNITKHMFPIYQQFCEACILALLWANIIFQQIRSQSQPAINGLMILVLSLFNLYFNSLI